MVRRVEIIKLSSHDLNALMEEFKKDIDKKNSGWRLYENSYFMDSDEYGVRYVMERDFPYKTSEEDMKKDGWILCSERLPEVQLTYDIFKRPDRWISDSVLVTVKSVHANNETHYYVSTDLRIGSRLEDVHWLMSCGIGGSAILHQEIIAWMPLPKPCEDVNQNAV